MPLDYTALPGTAADAQGGRRRPDRAELTLPEALEAPVQQGQTVGTVACPERGNAAGRVRGAVRLRMRQKWTFGTRIRRCCGRRLTGAE